MVYNGGGYDPWVEQVLTRHPGIKSVGAYSFLEPDGSNRRAADEHVFYDLNVAKSVAALIADRLSAIDPANAADYRANAAEFGRGADAIADSEHAIATTYPPPGSSQPNPSRTTCWRRPVCESHPARIRGGQSRTKPTRRRPTWRRSST